MDIGSLIRAERKAKGKPVAEIADALAISPNTIWELEKLSRGTMASLQRLCHFLGVEWIGLPPGSSLGARVRTARVRRGVDTGSRGEQGWDFTSRFGSRRG
jgi:transcriptional regulator with XRE-family HTH domain